MTRQRPDQTDPQPGTEPRRDSKSRDKRLDDAKRRAVEGAEDLDEATLTTARQLGLDVPKLIGEGVEARGDDDEDA